MQITVTAASTCAVVWLANHININHTFTTATVGIVTVAAYTISCAFLTMHEQVRRTCNLPVTTVLLMQILDVHVTTVALVQILAMPVKRVIPLDRNAMHIAAMAVVHLPAWHRYLAVKVTGTWHEFEQAVDLVTEFCTLYGYEQYEQHLQWLATA